MDGISTTAGLADVVDRITRKVRDGEMARRMVEKVTRYFRTKDPSDDLGRDEVRSLYRDEDFGDDFDVAGGKELDVGWTDHAEYRSELRDVDPSLVNEEVRDFVDGHPGALRRKVNLTRRGLGKAVVEVDTTGEPEMADVVTVMASEREAARTKNKKVEMTAPGSKNRWKVTYWDDQEKWVDSPPGRGKPSIREQRVMKKKLDRPSVKRAFDRLEGAFGRWMDGGSAAELRQAVEKNEIGLDKDMAQKVNRMYVKEIEKQKGDGISEKERQGLQVITDHVNRTRRDAMSRESRIAMKIAARVSEGDVCELDMRMALFLVSRGMLTPQAGIIRDVWRQGGGKVLVEEVRGEKAYVTAYNNPASRIVGGVDVPVAALKVVRVATLSP